MNSPPDIEPVLISALNEYVFCPRRCALKLIEGWWGDNEHTALGSLLHDHTDEPGYETDSGVTLLRALPLFSSSYGLVGKADIVEVRRNLELRSANCESKAADKSAIHNAQSEVLYAPVEYKKGRRRKWDNDDIQLCAQAFCLEEMFNVTVPEGSIYHAASKRRRQVLFDEQIRAETEGTIQRVRELLRSGEVPPALLKPRCGGCSLRNVCMPELTGSAVSPHYRREARELWQE